MRRFSLLYNRWAIILIMIYTSLPFAILPLYAIIEKFDFSLLEAARDLGATKWQSMYKVLIPLIIPGITTAVLFTFIPAFGNFAIPDIVGGNDIRMLGNIINEKLKTARNWPSASSISMVLTLMSVVMVLLFNRITASKDRQQKTEVLIWRKSLSPIHGKAPRIRAFFILTMVFFYAPLVILIIFSFNEGRSMNFTGFSFKWYKELFFNSAKLWGSFSNTLIIALVSALVSTVIGTLGAIGIYWYHFKLKKYLEVISYLPIILPEIIIGVSMLMFFARHQPAPGAVHHHHRPHHLQYSLCAAHRHGPALGI